MAETDEDLEALLKRLRLERFAGPLADLGAESVADLSYLQDADLEKAGIPVVPRRKILEAAGGQWRVTTSPPAGPSGPVLGLPALQDKASGFTSEPKALKEPKEAAEPAARHPWESLDEEEGFEISSEAKDELKLLMRDLRNLREDFATVNCLDLNSRNHLQSLPSRVALRSMGLLGCGNTFYMEGIRKPGAALAARARGAALDERKPGAKKAEPFEEWVKLLESFAAANKLSEATRNTLEGLDRTQALRVMGFTTALRFLAGPVVRGEAELEVSTRLWAAKSDAPMEAVLPRGDGEPARGAGGTKRDRSRSRRRASDSLPGLSRHVDTFIELNDLDERTSAILKKLEAKTVLQVMGLAGAENSFLLRGVREKSKAVLNRLRKVQEAGQDAELFGQLSKVMEDFITVNHLDSASAESFRGLPRDAALEVMGFAAVTDNSFLIREASDASEEVRRRIDARGASKRDAGFSHYPMAMFASCRRAASASLPKQALRLELPGADQSRLNLTILPILHLGQVGGWGGLGPIACFHFVLESGVSFVAILHAALLSSLCSMGQMEGRFVCCQLTSHPQLLNEASSKFVISTCHIHVAYIFATYPVH
ncbi:unnamed protein product [Symbiodinium sp. KB8]|nr:unnamed protein product [Symbiodinium sp. KB8]